MKTKNVYYSEKQAACYRYLGRHSDKREVMNQIRLDDGQTVVYTEICDGASMSLWDDQKLIASIPYEGEFDYSRCTTKGFW